MSWHQSIQLYSRSIARRVDVVLGISHSPGISKAMSTIRSVLEEKELVLANPPPVIIVNSLGLGRGRRFANYPRSMRAYGEGRTLCGTGCYGSDREHAGGRNRAKSGRLVGWSFRRRQSFRDSGSARTCWADSDNSHRISSRTAGQKEQASHGGARALRETAMLSADVCAFQILVTPISALGASLVERLCRKHCSS